MSDDAGGGARRGDGHESNDRSDAGGDTHRNDGNGSDDIRDGAGGDDPEAARLVVREIVPRT
jgi:hypothetical protein